MSHTSFVLCRYTITHFKASQWTFPGFWINCASMPTAEEFALGIDPKSLHATVLMQTVYNAVVQHSRGFLKHVVMSVTERVKIMAGRLRLSQML